ncbi:GntR family transcriptional regulator [Lentibacillus halodurans]|uniref:GntR family transcriptional regulator n=1 Tax=Lentibacillus halodurans TaxID=237679 RepID=A0A1I0ZSH1_9BACI|nr:GntR family transcriptional regulator [Lentibacillus halodurans]SFB27113.1 GntR family transcriptional regulator [Lentibacillus halodurans]
MEKNQSLHAYIKDELLNRIKSGSYKKGERIPTELELCKDFNVSRTTVRSALNQLTLEGYLVRKQGKGTYIADKKVSQTLSHTMKRYSDQVAVQGKKAKIALISIQVVPASERLEQSLNVAENDPIQRVERTRHANDEPTQYEISYIPWGVAPGITQLHAETSLYAALKEEFGVHIAKTTEHVEITLADENVSTLLQCEPGLPCFYIETVAEDENGNKVEFSRSYFRGDKTNFMIERNYSLDDH